MRDKGKFDDDEYQSIVVTGGLLLVRQLRRSTGVRSEMEDRKGLATGGC